MSMNDVLIPKTFTMTSALGGGRDNMLNFICFNIDGELAMSWYSDDAALYIFLDKDGTTRIDAVKIKNVKSSIGAIRYFTKYFKNIL